MPDSLSILILGRPQEMKPLATRVVPHAETQGDTWPVKGCNLQVRDCENGAGRPREPVGGVDAAVGANRCSLQCSPCRIPLWVWPVRNHTSF